MKRTSFRTWVIRLSIAALAALSVLIWSPVIVNASAAATTPHAHFSKSGNRYVIRGHLVPALKNLQAVRGTAGAQALTLSIALNPRNQDALDALLVAQNDPRSGLYHHYLTPQQYNAMFAPSQASVNAVVAYLRSQGLIVTSVASNRMLIDAKGSVSSVEHAFGVQISDFNLHGRSVYAPVNDPSVPTSLANMIVSIAGLSNVAVYHHATLAPTTSHNRGASGAPHAGSGPGGGYTPSELRTAYDMNSLISSANGSGQTTAIFELDSYQASDVNQYLSYYGLGSAKYSNVIVDGASTTPGSGAIEVELDMEDVSAIAPGATQKIYIGPNSTSGVNDTYNKIVTDNIAKVTSTSWGECEANSGNSELAALDNIFKQGATQGQAVFAAAGDSGAYDCGTSSLAVDSPADDPYVVGVGGTTLNTGSGGSYSSESVWGSGSQGGGGGLSTYFAQPSYQSGPGVSNSYSNGKREVPDVSADADPATGYSVYCTVTAAGCSSSGWISVGGTSAAAPLWAAVATDTNQYLAANGKAVLGSASATLYQLFNTSQTYTAYHDVTSGNNLYYPATSGYDLASGIGTPDVWNFARDAAGTSGGGGGSAPSISSFSPTSGAVGTSVTITGANFTGATAVKFNGTSASFTVASSTSISTTVPTGATTGPISVTTANGTGTSSASFTVSGGGGTTTQLLTNPGFESGQSPWQESSSGGYQIVDPTNPHTGSYSAWLCGYNNCNDQIWQTVTLPSTTTKVVLSYWLYIDTNEASGSPCYDNFYAKIRTGSGGAITTVQTKCNNNANNAWVQYSFDVTSATNGYHGQQIQVYFQGTNDVSLPSDFFVDDVALNVTH